MHPPLICRFVPASWHDDYSYHDALSRAWSWPQAIVNVEHDNEFSPALTEELLSCPQPLCTHAYRLYVPVKCWAHGRIVNAQTWSCEWVQQGAEFAEFSGIGFCKIAPEARTGPLARRPWRELERSVHEAVEGPWHIHWGADGQGIDHDHKEPR